MDSQTKSAIKSLVLDLRHTLEDELAIALRRYGVFTDRAWSLEAPPTRLTEPADREVWCRIVAVVRRGMKEGRTLPQASADYVRESAFTFLNRLVGLKCLEVRRIIDEVITTRDIYGGRSKAHRDYRDEHPRQARAADDALPACLEAVCRRVNDELIGYLFDPDDDHSLVWPRYAVLKSCIEKINALDKAVWAEDEIIGWIYQFYNAEEKTAIRKRGKPQTPHDVAVINQFFTPRWVVKFLVDNTLGRLWLEMYPDSPRVRAKCDYLVPELLPQDAEEQGSKGAEESFPISNTQYLLDPTSPINNPHAAPRRDPKPITLVRLLDPACGTMHFGHYACEVFDCMYRDARDRGEVTISDERIPSAILEYNLFGVDIDRRAVQLAALSLFMKARTMHPQARVRQVNLVAADATMPDSGVKKKFLARYAHDKRVQRAFAQVLDDMDNVAQVGSLLRVEERLRELLARAGHAAAAGELDPRRQHELPGPALSEAEGMEPDVRQMGLAEVTEEEEQGTDWTPHYTLQELRDDLRAFAREALQEHDLNAQLFAAEADKAVRLLDVLMGEYDVVVMNPPFGSTLDDIKTRLRKNFKAFSGNLLCAFVERALSDFAPAGMVGAVLDRTFLLKMSYEKFRRKILLEQGCLVAFTDLGWDVLDGANVEVSTVVLSAYQDRSDAVFFRAPKGVDLDEVATPLNEMEPFVVSMSDFESFPNASFAYWTPRSVRRMFRKFPPLDPSTCTAKEGIHPNDAKRFLRVHWEVDPKKIGRHKKWVPVANGGGYSPFYRDNQFLILYENEAEAIKSLRGMRNEHLQFKEGITWGKRTDLISLQYLPQGHAFTHEGHCLFPHDYSLLWGLLSLLNSNLMRYTVNTLCGQHKTSGYVGQLPYNSPELVLQERLRSVAKIAHDLRAAWNTGNEICTRFSIPWLLQLIQPQSDAFAQGLGRVLELLGDDASPTSTPTHPPTLAALLDRARAIEKTADARLQALQAQIDETVYDLYEISPADRALIERELGDRSPELVWPQMERKLDNEKRREHVRRFFSYYARQAVRADEDGVAPLAGCATREPYLVDRVRARLEAQFGPAAAYQLEMDAAAYFDRPLEEWLGRYFFTRFHVKLYKKRPVLWHLTSPRRHFAVMVDYHRLTRDTLPKVQTLYLWPQMEAVRTRLAAAGAGQALVRAPLKAIADLEDELADLEDCNERLESVIQGAVEVNLPDWANGPYRNGKAPYDPDLDDGVKVNLLPLQAAGLLPVKKVV